MSVTVSAYSADADASEPLSRQAFKFALVLGLHGVLVIWLAYNAAQLRETQINSVAERPPIPLDVRMINTPPPETPRPVTEPPRPLPQTPQPVVRQTESITPAPVLTAAPDADPAPVAFSVSPQPPAPPQEDAPPAPSRPPKTAPAPPLPITIARFDADYLQNPAPAYPALSRRLREEGTVLLLVRVTAQGDAEQVQVKHSSGFARLDEAALNAVRQWRFVPARRGDEPVAANVVVPIVFRLGD